MKNMKKICLALLLVLSLTLTASADIVYTVVDNYTSGSAGFIVQDGNGGLQTIKQAVTNLNGDHTVLSFNDATGAPRVLISQYTNGQPDVVWIYDPSTTDFSAPLKEVQWADFSNRRDVVSSGDSLYAICYDKPNLVKVDMTNNSYAQAAKYTFTTAATAQGYEVHGEAVEVIGDHIYALFTIGKDVWTTGDYPSSVVVKLNRDLNAVASVEVGKNALKMAAYGDKLYVTSVGGMQKYGSYNTDSRIERVDPDTMSATRLFNAATLAASDVSWKYDFRDIIFSPNGDAYVLAGAYDSSYMFAGVIYKTTADKLAQNDLGDYFADPAEVSFGYTWELRYDAVMGKLVLLAGYSINIYDPGNGSSVETINASALGGNLYSMTVIETPKTIGTDDGNGGGNNGGSSYNSGSGGGCNSGAPSLFLLAGLAFVAVKKKQSHKLTSSRGTQR